LHIPIITLTQRPTFIDKFVFTESEFFMTFQLNNSQDRKKVMEYVPFDISEPLAQYHSYYYDVAARKMTIVKPVPTGDDIVDVFYRRLAPLRKEPEPIHRRIVI
jgi:hypothetical protein